MPSSSTWRTPWRTPTSWPRDALTGWLSPAHPVLVRINSADSEWFRDDLDRARALGFGAKLCIHPKQVAPVNAAFAPSAAELAWAGRVVAAAGPDGAAVAVDGKMVDRPVILVACQMLEQAARRAAT